MPTTASLTAGNDAKKPISVLCLDAGGRQGISQLLILKDVMERLSKNESGDSQGIVRRPYEVFDMIGGVGTGGLIAIFLVVFKMTAKDALDEFTNFVVEVFKDVDRDPKKQTERLTWSINGILERYRIAKGAKLVVATAPGPPCKLVVPIMYRNHVGSSCVLRNYSSSYEPPVDLTIAEAMLATCSTPPIFTPMMISKDYATLEYVGGDLGLSNPTREIIAEAHRTFGHETTVSCLLSIGCGHSGVNPVPSDSHGPTWTSFLERLAMDSERTAQNIATQMIQLTLYHRFSVNYGLERNQSREWKDPESIAAHTTNYLNDLDVVELLDRCVDTIKHGDGFTTLERLRHSGGTTIISPPLPPLTRNYVDRKLSMEFIVKALFEEDGSIKNGSKTVVVTGIGGCGKTQLIRNFIEKYKHLFASTFFIDGSSPDAARRDVVRHVRALGGTCSQKSFDESMLFLSQAVHNGERLFVMDNVDDSTFDLAPFLPRWGKGVVIITSRDHSRGQLNAEGHLQLDVMTTDESVELLIRGSGQQWPPTESDKALAISVAEELGCHPIALAQAISYKYNTGCSPRDYVTLLRGNRERLLRDYPATSQVDMRYKTAFAAFDASYGILPPKAQNLWHLLSFFRCQRFPVELITLAAPEGFSHERHHLLYHGEEFELGSEYLKELFYSSDKWDPLELRSILGTLRSHSLITMASTGNVTLLQMHPLVHEWGRLRISEGSLRLIEAAAVRLLCCGAKEDNYSMMQYLSSHVEGLCSALGLLQANDIACLAFILQQSGMYDKAATLACIVHEMVEYELGPNHSNTVTASSNLAVLYARLGRYSEAKDRQTETLRRSKQILGQDHPETITEANNLAATCYELGHYDEAKELQATVLRRQEQRLGVDHPDTVWASERLAVTYNKLGRHAEAEELQKEVLRQRKQALGSDHPEAIWASDHLAVTYHQLGRYAEAEELQTRVLQQRERLLGVDHPDTIRASAQLAATHYALRRYAEAEELYNTVVKKRTTILGERHPDTIRSMLYLAQTYNATGRQSEAFPLAQKALQFALETLGDVHPLSQEISKFVASLLEPAQTTRGSRFALFIEVGDALVALARKTSRNFGMY